MVEAVHGTALEEGAGPVGRAVGEEVLGKSDVLEVVAGVAP